MSNTLQDVPFKKFEKEVRGINKSQTLEAQAKAYKTAIDTAYGSDANEVTPLLIRVGTVNLGGIAKVRNDHKEIILAQSLNEAGTVVQAAQCILQNPAAFFDNLLSTIMGCNQLINKYSSNDTASLPSRAIYNDLDLLERLYMLSDWITSGTSLSTASSKAELSNQLMILRSNIAAGIPTLSDFTQRIFRAILKPPTNEDFNPSVAAFSNFVTSGMSASVVTRLTPQGPWAKAYDDPENENRHARMQIALVAVLDFLVNPPVVAQEEESRINLPGRALLTAPYQIGAPTTVPTFNASSVKKRASLTIPYNPSYPGIGETSCLVGCGVCNSTKFTFVNTDKSEYVFQTGGAWAGVPTESSAVVLLCEAQAMIDDKVVDKTRLSVISDVYSGFISTIPTGTNVACYAIPLIAPDTEGMTKTWVVSDAPMRVKPSYFPTATSPIYADGTLGPVLNQPYIQFPYNVKVDRYESQVTAVLIVFDVWQVVAPTSSVAPVGIPYITISDAFIGTTIAPNPMVVQPPRVYTVNPSGGYELTEGVRPAYSYLAEAPDAFPMPSIHAGIMTIRCSVSQVISQFPDCLVYLSCFLYSYLMLQPTGSPSDLRAMCKTLVSLGIDKARALLRMVRASKGLVPAHSAFSNLRA